MQARSQGHQMGSKVVRMWASWAALRASTRRWMKRVDAYGRKGLRQRGAVGARAGEGRACTCGLALCRPPRQLLRRKWCSFRRHLATDCSRAGYSSRGEGIDPSAAGFRARVLASQGPAELGPTAMLPSQICRSTAGSPGARGAICWLLAGLCPCMCVLHVCSQR